MSIGKHSLMLGALMALGFGSPAEASAAPARHLTEEFECVTKLEFSITRRGVKELYSVDFSVVGHRSARNTLVGGADVQAGPLQFVLHSPSATLSENVILLRGGHGATQSYLSFSYLRNSDASNNPSNKVILDFETVYGRVRASNERISTEDPHDDYPIVCSYST